MTVSRTTSVDRPAASPRPARTAKSPSRLGVLDVLLLSVWCGLAAGLLEVGARVVFRAIDPTMRLYLMSRHFIWLTPLVNMLLFFGLGLCLAGTTRLWPRLGGWISPRFLCALALLPSLMVAFPHIFPEGWFVLTLGVASRVIPWLERHPTALRRRLALSFPGLLGLVLLLAGSVFGGEWLKQRREAGRALPPAESPNVLFITLDTVRADRLSLYGYQRPTTPTLERLAKQGIRFDAARATAPWTLPSHASMFTGQWPHQLGVEWLTPIRSNSPMLAEYLGARGYATAGFVSNAGYCSYDTGLDRGFSYYEDYVLQNLNPLRTSVLFEETLMTFFLVGARYDSDWFNSLREVMQQLFSYGIRRNAASINRGFVAWLEGRREPGRPFFVFLNYLEAHTPYQLPEGAKYRFGRKPQTRDELRIINEIWSPTDKLQLPKHYLLLARDCYDNCLAYLDECLGELFHELERRGTLDRTWVIITGDHGEGLGEHNLFEHGESLYSTEIHVPLLILPPAASRSGRVVRQIVSLRDLAATVVDLVGHAKGAPFPGRSLANLWRDSPPRSSQADEEMAVSELSSPSPTDSNQGRSPGHRGPLISLAAHDFVYIRNEGDGTEELFDERDDPRELTNRAGADVMRPILQRFRERLVRIKTSQSRPAR
jgi:arylsulfatase A-like enzyme